MGKREAARETKERAIVIVACTVKMRLTHPGVGVLGARRHHHFTRDPKMGIFRSARVEECDPQARAILYICL